jgi:bud site selection protein 31
MPAIRHASKRKAPPAGFSDIEDSLLIFANKMKDAEAKPSTNIPKHQVHWPIFQISHQRSRYVWELYQQEKISKELYDWLLKNKYADAMLIAKWKKDSYAKVCTSYFFMFRMEANICLVVLLEMYTDQGDELQFDMHMSRAKSES